MKVREFIGKLRDSKNMDDEKLVIVDATDREGRLLAAFLKSNFDQAHVLVVSQDKEKREEL